MHIYIHIYIEIDAGVRVYYVHRNSFPVRDPIIHPRTQSTSQFPTKEKDNILPLHYLTLHNRTLRPHLLKCILLLSHTLDGLVCVQRPAFTKERERNTVANNQHIHTYIVQSRCGK